MKRTTIISIGFTLATVLATILFITYLTYQTCNLRGAFLVSKERIELPKCTKVQFVYTTDTIKHKRTSFLASEIVVFPNRAGTGTYLSADPTLLDKITTTMKGDVLTIHLDLSDSKLWVKYMGTFIRNRRRGSLIDLGIAPEVMSLTNASKKPINRVTYRVTGLNRTAFDLDLSKSNLILERDTIQQLTISNARDLELYTVNSQHMTLINDSPTGFNNFWHKKCTIDTLEIRNNSALDITRFTAPKHILWKPLSDKASLSVTLKSKQTFEKIKAGL